MSRNKNEEYNPLEMAVVGFCIAVFSALGLFKFNWNVIGCSIVGVIGLVIMILGIVFTVRDCRE